MRTWLLFGAGICLALVVVSVLERPPPRAARPLDADFAAPKAIDAPFPDAPAPLEPVNGAARGTPLAPTQVSGPSSPGTAAPAIEPADLVVARLADRARREPAAALAEALSLAPPALRESAVRAVLAAWSPAYPAAAAAHFEALSTYAERAAAAALFARVYAERDPFAALEWLRALTPPIVEPARDLLASIAAIPPARAIEIVRETAGTENERTAAVVRLVAITREIDPGSVRELANAALALPPTESAVQLLAVLVGDWAAADAVAALEWLTERADVLGPSVFMQAAYRIGAHDPNAGAGYTDRVPLALRSAWIGAVAAGYANVNPFAAVEWISRYEGDAAHPDAVVAVAEPLALFDGPAAAALLDGVDPALPRYVNAIAGVGAGWARQDAPAAAAWAEGLPTRDARAGAIAAVAREWLVDDPDRALELALKLPRGAARDRVLGLFLSGNSFPTDRDRIASNGFFDWTARTRALEEAAEALRLRQERERVERERAQSGR